MNISDNTRVISAVLTERGTIEIVRFTPSNLMYCGGKQCPGKLVKEIYAVGKDNKIVLTGIADGYHTPASVQPERFEFPNES